MSLISVVIPTYKRLPLLKSAIASVQAQTYQNWELIISDDEDPSGETWSYLQSLPGLDGRIRPVKNIGPHGQWANTNNGLRSARGEWVKLLHDDDLMRPTCLAVFVAAVQRCPSAVLASCRRATTRGGNVISEEQTAGRPTLELIPQRYAHMGMYLIDDMLGVPSQVMVRRDCIERGAVFEPHPGLTSGVDTLWYIRVLQHGDNLIINRVLVEWFAGDHVSVTSQMSQEAMDREMELLGQLQFDMIDPALKPPSPRVQLQTLRLIRAFHSISKRNAMRAARLAFGVWRPMAWKLALNWLRRRYRPGSCPAVPRIIIPADGIPA